MKPQWQKLASLAQENAHSGFNSLVQSLLPKDTLLRTYLSKKLHTLLHRLKNRAVSFCPGLPYNCKIQ